MREDDDFEEDIAKENSYISKTKESYLKNQFEKPNYFNANDEIPARFVDEDELNGSKSEKIKKSHISNQNDEESIPNFGTNNGSKIEKRKKSPIKNKIEDEEYVRKTNRLYGTYQIPRDRDNKVKFFDEDL